MSIYINTQSFGFEIFEMLKVAPEATYMYWVYWYV